MFKETDFFKDDEENRDKIQSVRRFNRMLVRSFMNGDSYLDPIIDDEQDEKEFKDEEIVQMMNQRGLFVEKFEDLVTPGFNVNHGDQGIKCCIVDLV